MRFIAKNKKEAGRQLATIKNEIAALSSKFNNLDIIILLLCLEDAIHNFEIMFLKHFTTTERLKRNKELLLSVYQFITQWYQVINESILAISGNINCFPPKNIKIPQFCFGICLQSDINDCLLELYRKGRLSMEDLILCKPRLFLNRIPGWFFIAVRGDYNEKIKDRIVGVLELRDLFYKKGLLETMIYMCPEGTVVEFDDSTGLRRITLPAGVTVESLLELEGVTPIAIETYTKVFDWNSFFQEIAKENLRSIDLGKGPKNLDFLKKEDEELYKAYSSINGFSETFRNFYGVELHVFFSIVSEIMYLCYNNIHTLGWWEYHDLLKEKRLNQFSIEDVKRTIHLLSGSTRAKGGYGGFIIIGNHVLTNFRRLSVSRIILLEKCFGEVFNNDLKGKAFEEACRNILRDRGFKTLPGRVEVTEPVVPPQVAFSLWGKQKQKTDFDVISSQNNNVLVIECKEIKSPDLKPRQLKQFKKYLVEHFYKTKWIQRNFRKFCSYTGVDICNLLSIDKKRPLYLFPLLVTNILIPVEGIAETPLITFIELKEIASKGLPVMNDNHLHGVLELEVSTRKLELPWLLIVI